MPEVCQKIARKLPENRKKVARKLQESCQKVFQKIARKLPDSFQTVARNLPDSCQKLVRQLPESHEKVMRQSTPVADHCRHVCSCLFSEMITVTPIMGGHKTMACLSGKGHGNNSKVKLSESDAWKLKKVLG